MTNPNNQPTYSGRFSEIYDLFYAHKTYTQEATFVQSLLTRFGDKPHQKILELGCGTGTHSFLLEDFGHEILATDLSPDMIEKAIQKAASRGSKIKFAAQDMLELDQPKRPFDAVICLFDSFCYILDNDDVEEVLKRVHDHLKPGGLFIFEFWNAAAMINHLDPIRVKRLAHGEDQLVKISEAELDYQRQLYKVKYTLYEMHADGRCQTYTEDHTNRFYQIQEMAYFLTRAGFNPLKWYAGYTEAETICDADWNIVCVAHAG
ncbi:MAG: class I SAM-dependent methyltransferase [Brevefilum sp.]|nr:class I SAM-dependent methyltransferase [Brevefilum sp.]